MPKRLINQRIGQVELGFTDCLQLGFEVVAEGEQLVDFGDDAAGEI